MEDEVDMSLQPEPTKLCWRTPACVELCKCVCVGGGESMFIIVWHENILLRSDS